MIKINLYAQELGGAKRCLSKSQDKEKPAPHKAAQRDACDAQRLNGAKVCGRFRCAN
jgi:hypothetical protein